MSLILRSKCQPLLDNVGLSQYHTDVNDQNTVSILGECGKPLATLSGIRFADKTPTADELILAEPLVKDFLDLHYKDITNYITEAGKLAKLVEPKYNPKYDLDSQYRATPHYYRIKYVNGVYMVTAHHTGQITAVRLRSKKKFTISMLNKAIISQIEHDKAMAYMTTRNNYTELKDTVDQLKQKLSTCNI